ncbi:hypothetical protein ABBQ32_008732 [Trebouxia sp. C0010 RCD-2024]
MVAVSGSVLIVLLAMLTSLPLAKTDSSCHDYKEPVAVYIQVGSKHEMSRLTANERSDLVSKSDSSGWSQSMTASTNGVKVTPYNLTISYWPGGGLCNQLSNIVNTLVIAYAMQAAVQLQSSGHRDTYNSEYYDMRWTPDPIISILNVEEMQHFWMRHGVSVYDSENVTELEGADRDHPPDTFVTNLKLHEGPARTLTSVTNRVLSAALTRIADLEDGEFSWQSQFNMRANLGWPNERLQISSQAQFFHLADSSVSFAPELERIADDVFAKMADSFNAVHLRIEYDYVHHPAIDHQGSCADSLHCLEHQFVPACQHAGFNNHTPLYVASGIFLARPDLHAEVLRQLAPYGSQIIHKEQVLDAHVLQRLTSEQLAVIDFLLCRRADTFVGVLESTFSKLVSRHRLLYGHNEQSNIFAREFDPARLNIS